MMIDEVRAWLATQFTGVAELEVRHVGGDVYDVYIVPARDLQTFALLTVRESEEEMRLLVGGAELIDQQHRIAEQLAAFLGE